MKNICFLIGVLALASLATLPASAGILYNNDYGGVVSGDNYNMDGFTLNFGYEVADSFVLGANSTVQGFNFAVWEYLSDPSLSTVDWQILANNGGTPVLGTVLASGTASPTGTLFETNGYGYTIFNESFSIADLGLSAGTTYWLTLQNAVVPSGDPVYWDQSDGPSAAYDTGIGSLLNYQPCGGLCTGSESFQVLGTTSGVPEPGTLLLLGGALIALAGIRRKK